MNNCSYENIIKPISANVKSKIKILVTIKDFHCMIYVDVFDEYRAFYLRRD
jgi:hypothetical protein